MDPLFAPSPPPPFRPSFRKDILCPSGLGALHTRLAAHSPCRPPASRLWASSAAEAQLMPSGLELGSF